MGPLPFGSGRRRHRHDDVSDAGRASMGPLPFGSGRVALQVSNQVDVTLQWGRSLSEAEGRLYGLDRTPIHALQWGRSLSEAEGSVWPLLSAMLTQQLQWGRSLSEAEGRHVASLAEKVVGLQWGRSLSEAEGLCAVILVFDPEASMGPLPFGSGRPLRRNGALPMPVQGFNGAAPFRKRKVDVASWHLREWLPASMGPLPFGSGRLRSAGHVPNHGATASMGPLPFGSGRMYRAVPCVASWELQWGRSLSEAEGTSRTSWSRPGTGSFNGAAPFRKRKDTCY